MNINNIIENETEKELYQKKYRELKEYLKTFGPTNFWKIIKDVGGSERRMLRLINEMVNNNEIVYLNGKFNLIDNQKKYNNIDFDELEHILKNICSKKPIPTLLFDQRPVTVETVINRVKYLLKNNDVYNKKIVFLGDDDLTSVALALTNIDCEILVLDIDKRLIDFINKINKEYNLNINAKVYNVINGIKNIDKHKFDCLITDPTPEKIPFTIFMNNAIDLLKKNNGIIYTSIYSSAMEESLELQKIINKMNLYITDIIPKFTLYQSLEGLFNNNDIEIMKKYNIKLDKNSICFTESLFRMKTTNKTKKITLRYTTEEIFGKATKRVIKDSSKDLIKHSNKYINDIKNTMIKNIKKEYESK